MDEIESMRSDNVDFGGAATTKKKCASKSELNSMVDRGHDGEDGEPEEVDPSPDKRETETFQGEEQIFGVSKRKPHRRKQGGTRHNNKKWRPYNKLSWQERKELDDRESRRACLKREERFASGHPVAPYNTTQFLMEEHSKTENISPALHNEVLNQHSNHSGSARNNEAGSVTTGSNDSLDEYYDSPNDEESFIAKDFSETYDNIHAEHIETMSKAELVKDYMDLELKVEKMECKLKVYESLNIIEKKSALSDFKQNSLLDPNSRPLMADQKLKYENERLKRENSDLRRQVEILRAQTKIL